MVEKILDRLAIYAFVLCGVLLVVWTVQTVVTRTYILDTEVVEINGTQVFVEDTTGHLWKFYDGKAELGNEYILVMDNMGNENIHDDVISWTLKGR